MKDDHKYIWLEPEPPMDDDEVGRTWCQDNVYDPYDYDGNEPTIYVRNDIHKKRIAELEKWNQGLNTVNEKLLDRAKRAENKLDAVKAIREQYNNLIKQERGLVGANTVLDMIDAALEYKQGC